MYRRSPHGERGLKYLKALDGRDAALSLPTRGAWIEIHFSASISDRRRLSLPTRGAWIEIVPDKQEMPYITVAPHTGSVD